MKVDKIIKDRFVYGNKNNPIRYIYLFYHKYIKKYYKKSYSFSAVDLLIDRFFRNLDKGVYLDVGCYHPIKGSNTYLLHKKGWEGINIDLDQHAISLFNKFRPNDYNIVSAISNKNEKTKLYSHHTHSPIQTISKKTSNKKNYLDSITTEIETKTLNSIIENSPFSKKKVDLLTIDIEGHEYEALKHFNFKKYNPSLIIVEYNDLSLIELEFFYQDIKKILSSEIYNLFISNGYKFVNWHHADLIFVSEEIYNERKVYQLEDILMI